MNNQYPYGMNPYPQTQSPMTFGSTLNWVNGTEGAKAFQLRPNSNVLLLDSENDGIFYIKTSDNVGMCNIRTFKYEEVTNTMETKPVTDLSEYVRKDELSSLIHKVLNKEERDEQAVSRNKRKSNNSKPLIDH